MIAVPLAERTIPRTLAASRGRGPDRPLLVTRERTWTHAEVDDEAGRLAGALSSRGVRRGGRVALLLQRDPRYVLVLLALARLGAVAVALNTDAKGRILSYYVQDSGCRHAIVDAAHAETLARATPDGDLCTLRLEEDDDWIARLGTGPSVADDDAVAFSDPFVVLYTSGTTGMPKGVAVTHAHAVTAGGLWAEFMGFSADDRLYTCLPFFHINATAYSLAGALVSGAALAIGPHFSARGFWDDIAALGATQVNAMGSMLKILEGRDPHEAERTHGARMMFLAPLPVNARELSTRFALDFTTTYAQTEWLPSSLTRPGEGYDRPGGTGLVLPSSEVVIVGADDMPLAPGATGEIALRTHEPYTAFTGYLGKAEDSLEAFRNLRFHTGDLGVLDADGWLTFRGRAKDVIRRRGENISAMVLEDLLGGHPDVAEVAAVPVPSALLEDEVFVYVVAREGAEIDPAEFLRFSRDVLPRHMVPMYADFVDDLPRTATNKVAKTELRTRAEEHVRSGTIRPMA